MNNHNPLTQSKENAIVLGEEDININNSKKIKENKIENNIENENKKVNIVDGISFEIQIDPDYLTKKNSEMEDYICPLCKGLLLNPVIDSCSHTFCKDCFEKYYNIKKQCPITKKKLSINDLTHVDVISKSIGKKEMKCKNYNKGCNWIGKVSDIDFHLKNECLKSLIKCTFKNCNKMIMREELENHIQNCEFREEKCNDCQKMFPFKEIMEHFNLCTKKKIKCVQGCGAIIERGEMDSHIKNFCENSVVDCKFKEFGCMDKFKKREMNVKMESGCYMHLNLIADYLLQMSKQLKENDEKLNRFQLEIETLNNKFDKFKNNEENNSNKANIINNNNNNDNNNNNINNKNNNNGKNNNNTINLNNNNKNNNVTHNNTINLNNNIINNNNNGNNNHNINQINKNILHYQKIKDPLQNKKLIIEIRNDSILNKKREREKSEVKINENIFDTNKMNQLITIKGNKASYNASYADSHVYLFSSPEYDIDIRDNKIRTWKVNLLNKSKWIAFGLCDKTLVLSNNQLFCTNLKDIHFNNGSYLISSNGFSWNCNNKLENNKKIDFPNFNEILSFKLTFNPNNFELCFYYDLKLIKKLTNVKPISSGKTLTPCIVFLDNNNEIELLLNNE